jgi:hypothetical protein
MIWPFAIVCAVKDLMCVFMNFMNAAAASKKGKKNEQDAARYTG